MRSASRAVLWLLLGFAAACGRQGDEARRYQLTGHVLAVRPATSELLVKHDDIPNFMPAMTMPYKVRDPGVLGGVAAGDLVTATLVVEESDAWLAAIEKTGTAPLPETPAVIPPAAGVTLLAVGDEAPRTTLTDQDGKPIAIDDWQGRAVAVTFIYTQCPLPQFCPMLDRRFAEAQRIVAADPALARRVRFLSVSFDPDADTPARLAAHAAKLGANPEIWRFATAPRDEVDRFAAHFGVNVIREADRTITHNLRTAVIGPDGRVAALHDGADWTAGTLVDDLRHALSTDAHE